MLQCDQLSSAMSHDLDWTSCRKTAGRDDGLQQSSPEEELPELFEAGELSPSRVDEKWEELHEACSKKALKPTPPTTEEDEACEAEAITSILEDLETREEEGKKWKGPCLSVKFLKPDLDNRATKPCVCLDPQNDDDLVVFANLVGVTISKEHLSGSLTCVQPPDAVLLCVLS